MIPESLEQKIGYTFQNKSLLQTALTHSSFANEKNSESYERLEFLGDSILGAVTAEFLYSYVPPLPEGQMTRLRSDLVCEDSLFKIACRLGISEHMRISHGAEKTGMREVNSVLADMVESVIAAIYLDSGLDEAKKFIYTMILNDADLSSAGKTGDYKSALQEFVQRDGPADIKYLEESESGPDHNKTFNYAVSVNGEILGRGTGKTKKGAEQRAASAALEVLRERDA